MKLKETLHKRVKIYQGRAVGFSVDEIVLPDGKIASREYLEHPGAVAVLPFVDKKRIILVRQYRYPVRETTYEIPAGKLDAGEKLLACVKRELEEETGYRAKKIKKIISYWPTPAFSNEILHVYFASDLEKTKKNPDEDEFIESKVVNIDEALKMVRSGKIKDSKTVIALLYWAGVKG